MNKKFFPITSTIVICLPLTLATSCANNKSDNILNLISDKKDITTGDDVHMFYFTLGDNTFDPSLVKCKSNFISGSDYISKGAWRYLDEDNVFAFILEIKDSMPIGETMVFDLHFTYKNLNQTVDNFKITKISPKLSFAGESRSATVLSSSGETEFSFQFEPYQGVTLSSDNLTPTVIIRYGNTSYIKNYSWADWKLTFTFDGDCSQNWKIKFGILFISKFSSPVEIYEEFSNFSLGYIFES